MAASLIESPWLVLGFYLVMSLLTFVVYARDKAAAIQQRRRTPEKTLHWLALCGGWPGAWLAQQLLRHKSKKLSFKLVFWGTVLLHNLAIAALIYGFNPT